MSETTQSFRPPRGSAMTRTALSVLTAAAATTVPAAPAAGCGYPGFTECGAWGRAEEVRSFLVRRWAPGAAGGR
ncbi:hypothetical protein [Kitasatospora sp. NPDC015120]|uniref:hypothetical protein n=1 Tax=Kitasatospora sp. NPDC015120 TaxID=3364023 RepID=UPI0036F45481